MMEQHLLIMMEAIHLRRSLMGENPILYSINLTTKKEG